MQPARGARNDSATEILRGAAAADQQDTRPPSLTTNKQDGEKAQGKTHLLCFCLLAAFQSSERQIEANHLVIMINLVMFIFTWMKVATCICTEFIQKAQ